jgi:hypothetical protein
METWELEFKWLRVQHVVKTSLSQDKLPDLQSILFLIGIQELGQLRRDFTKEEKQDLMHIAVCSLLSQEGFFEFVGRDEDGWPHFKQLKVLPSQGVEDQEALLKLLVVDYFKDLENENGGFDV